MKKSISFWSFNGKTAAQAMQLAKDAGFDGIELTLDAAGDLTMDTTDEQVLALKQTAERIGIALPSVASSLYWAYSFTSDDAAEREQAHNVAVRQLHIAKLLGADTILVVPGSVSVEFVPERPVVPYDVAYDRALEACKELAKDAEEAGVVIALENVWNKFLLSPLETRDFIDKIGSDYVKVYFDIGNVLVTGYPEHWVKILGERIARVHVKDFRTIVGNINGFVDLLGGDANFPAVMKELRACGYDGYLTAEMNGFPCATDAVVVRTLDALERIVEC